MGERARPSARARAQVVELMGTRKGQMQEMASGVEGGSRVTYTIPTRGLLGAARVLCVIGSEFLCGSAPGLGEERGCLGGCASWRHVCVARQVWCAAGASTAAAPLSHTAQYSTAFVAGAAAHLLRHMSFSQASVGFFWDD